MFAGLRKPRELIVIVVTLLAYGCPVQAIVHAFELDERTVASWRDRAGKHCKQVHHALVEQGQLDLVHVQADEIRVKGHQLIAWMGLAMMVSTRLWLAGVVSLTRDRNLADRLLTQVRACCQPLRALLVCTDGWSAYPRQHSPGVSGESEKDRWERTSVFASLAGDLHCHGHQADQEETGGGSDPAHDPGNTRTSPAAARAVARRNRAQHGFYRAVECTHAAAASQLDAQMSPCRSSPASAGDGDVRAGMHVQLLLAAP